MDISTQYNEIAKLYDEVKNNGNETDPIRNAMFKHICKLNLFQKSVLDLGCGPGYDLEKIRKISQNVI